MKRKHLINSALLLIPLTLLAASIYLIATKRGLYSSDSVSVEDTTHQSSDRSLREYDWEIPVKVVLPDGEILTGVVHEQFDVSYIAYCHSADIFIKKFLEEKGIQFTYSSETGQFTSIAGKESQDGSGWQIYLEGSKSPYKAHEHCLEDGWEISVINE